MNAQSARYDGHADWYERTFSAFHPLTEELAFLTQALGPGDGEICIDLACGTGLWAQPIATAGYRPLGVDISADQLRFARLRIGSVVQANACDLPVREASVRLIVGMFFHTDVENFAVVVRQVARCLRPGGRFVYVGVHPCFIGPFVNRTAESVVQQLHFSPGYGRVGWATRASGDGSGVGPRVGFHHKTLAGSLTAISESGLRISAVQEFASGGVVLPRNIGLITEK